MDALLPAWILGSVFVIAVIDWLRTPRVTHAHRPTFVAESAATA